MKSSVSILFPISYKNLLISVSLSKLWTLSGPPYFTCNYGARSQCEEENFILLASSEGCAIYFGSVLIFNLVHPMRV